MLRNDPHISFSLANSVKALEVGLLGRLQPLQVLYCTRIILMLDKRLVSRFKSVTW